METLEDVLREMRDRNEVRKVRLRQYGGVHCNCSIMPDDLPKEYADRIEKAYRRSILEDALDLYHRWRHDGDVDLEFDEWLENEIRTECGVN